MLKLHFEILDEKRFKVFDRLPDVVERGYLVGGYGIGNPDRSQTVV